MTQEEKADLVSAAEELMGKTFPSQKYLAWRDRFSEAEAVVVQDDGTYLYACGHAEAPSHREAVKMSLAGFRQPCCSVCRVASFEKIQKRAASKERAKNTLGLHWPSVD